MKWQSKQDQIENCLVAIDMVKQLKPNQLVADLSAWRSPEGDVCKLGCGGQACIGGWVAVHPFFRKKGVVARGEVDSEIKAEGQDSPWYGEPTTRARKEENRLVPDTIAEKLFGPEGSSVFDSRHYEEEGTERQVALSRLRKAL